jgi:OOP family OmpA-OmpF porin
MRDARIVAGGLALMLALTGCANFSDRQWSTCAAAGGVVGAVVGGVTGGTVANNANSNPDDTERGAAIGGGIVAGAALGALLGHVLCDPMKETPAPPPAAPPPPPPPSKKMVELHGPQFDFNKATLKPDGKKRVDTAVQTMKDEPSLKVSVDGHTDSIGSDAYNLKLSERRAQAVKDYMVSQGVSASRIATHGYGKSKPVADNKTAEGRAENRRVEINRD